LPPDLFTELPPELLQERPPARQNAALEPPADRRFSVPLITSLESGKKYIQIVAYNKPEDVENQLTQIGQSYPLVVQPGGKNPEKPLYRILIGPLNSGETGPLLQQFKQSGYHDAYIR
jgi:hypothetical protein